MRKLKTRDIPAFCRVLKALGMKDRIKEVAKEADKMQDVWDKGFDLVWSLFDVATEAKGEGMLYAFFAGPFEMTPEEFADLELPALMDGLHQLAEENNLLGFFKSAAASMPSSSPICCSTATMKSSMY